MFQTLKGQIQIKMPLSWSWMKWVFQTLKGQIQIGTQIYIPSVGEGFKP